MQRNYIQDINSFVILHRQFKDKPTMCVSARNNTEEKSTRFYLIPSKASDIHTDLCFFIKEHMVNHHKMIHPPCLTTA